MTDRVVDLSGNQFKNPAGEWATFQSYGDYASIQEKAAKSLKIAVQKVYPVSIYIYTYIYYSLTNIKEIVLLEKEPSLLIPTRLWRYWLLQ